MREKHIMGGLLCSCLLLGSLTGCGANWKSKLLYGYEKTLSSLGGFQRTSKQQLYGMRLDGEDAYTGTYQADCRNVRGKDVVFGGCSIQTRTLWLTGTVGARNGIVEIYVLNGEKEKEYLPDSTQPYLWNSSAHAEDSQEKNLSTTYRYISKIMQRMYEKEFNNSKEFTNY